MGGEGGVEHDIFTRILFFIRKARNVFHICFLHSRKHDLSKDSKRSKMTIPCTVCFNFFYRYRRSTLHREDSVGRGTDVNINNTSNNSGSNNGEVIMTGRTFSHGGGSGGGDDGQLPPGPNPPSGGVPRLGKFVR